MMPTFERSSKVHLWHSCTTNRKTSSENRKASSKRVSFKKWKASSEDCWIHAHISFRSTELIDVYRTWVTMLAPQCMLVVNIVQSTTGCSARQPKSCADEFYLCG